MSELRGKVVLIDFWTYTCINCIRTLPYLEAWQQRYGRDGFTVVGVHSPGVPLREGRGQRPGRDPAEPPHLPGRPGQRPGHLGRLGQPVLAGRLPGRRAGARPRRSLRRGRLRRDRARRSGRCSRTRATANLGGGARASAPGTLGGRHHAGDLSRRNPRPGLGERADPPRQSGLRRSSRRPARPTSSRTPATGAITDEDATSGAGGGIDLEFNSRRVFLVLGSPGQARHVQVLLDGKPIPAKLAGADVRNGEVTVEAQRLYRLVDLPAVAQHRLSLRFEPGVSGYAFTFG